MNKLFTIALSLFMINSVQAKRFLIQNPARAIWNSSNEISFTLTNPLSVNDILSYSLENSENKIQISLKPHRAFNQKVFFKLPTLSHAELSKLITGPLKLVVKKNEEEVDSTSIQLSSLLDKEFYYSGKLGLDFSDSKFIIVRLWAPTASAISLNLYSNAADETPNAKMAMQKNQLGVWELTLNPREEGKFYLFQIDVFQPQTDQMERYLVTDPYSISLSLNSTKSQIINVDSNNLKPNGWDQIIKKEDNVKTIYETHLRDLTAKDFSLPENLRGTYLGAVDSRGSAYKHLKNLAEKGLSHIHLMPVNDFATVNENKVENAKADLNLSIEHGASSLPQDELNSIRSSDNYNWGYDPLHYLVPEGSYALNPNGPSRILEFRKMVAGFNDIGLKVIVDVVFNHTYSSGNDRFSILNKVVPLYYYRLSESGQIYNSSCCADTASENKMMEKLMIDSVLHWAKTYKVDGFRFDLMSFHSRSTMLKIKEAIKTLTLNKDGVDGSTLYLYGEGWNFGSLLSKENNDAFTQLNSYGAGIGFFNDRFRDAIRGGTTDHNEISDQGFVTGLYSDFNAEIANRNTPINLEDQKIKLLILGDVVKIGLAGNLRDFRFKNFVGDEITGGQFYFRGSPTAYSYSTNETINYVSAHDGYTLFDAVTAKAPFYTEGRTPKVTSSTDKQRMVTFALGLTLFSQGVAFIEGGSELMRSKSGDVDSYDSGDWFNIIDWSFENNNWAKGLPPSFKNYSDWSFWYPRLIDPKTQIGKQNILNSLKTFEAYLSIRKNSTLFNEKNSAEMSSVLTFFDNGKSQIPGLIAMRLKNQKEEMIILFNANRTNVNFSHPIFSSNYQMHPLLNGSIDEELNKFRLADDSVNIPGRTIVVLIPAKK